MSLPDSHPIVIRTTTHWKGNLMKTSIIASVAAFAAAAFVTFGVIDLIAGYAYPEAPPVRLATARR